MRIRGQAQICESGLIGRPHSMEARGGAEGLEVESPKLYLVLMTLLFVLSVLANSNGFFGPWKA